MSKFITTKNFLEKYLILELFEKLYRLKKYISTCEKFDKKNNNDKIINLFKTSIEIIGKEVDFLTTDLNSELEPHDKFAFILKISQHSTAIIKIHEELKNLHSSWILPEINTFTNEILKARFDPKQGINIILSDNYSFLESNLSKKFANSLAKVYIRTNTNQVIADNHSFILPKIEFSNPLNWTIIAHEAGHLQDIQINSLRCNPLIMPDDIQAINEEKIQNWAEEIFCDLYATSLLGPAYFISFVSFALLRTMDFGISAHSDIHPSIIIRASIVRNYLRDKSILFNPAWGIDDYTNIFYESLIEQHSIFKDESGKAIPGLTKFNRNLRKLINELELSSFSINESDSIRIKNLVSKLERGVPIGSVSDGNREDIFHELDQEITKEKLDSLKALVSERPTKLWEILNAGWIYKLEYSCNSGETIFFNSSNTKDVMEKVDEYGKIVDFLDGRLLSSINTSQIIKIIEDN